MAVLELASIASGPARTGTGDDAPIPSSAVIAGCVAVLIAASLLCHIPAGQSLSRIAVFAIAVLYMVAAVLAGAVGAWLFWKPASDRSVPRLLIFVLSCGAAWIWVPAVVLLLRQNSIWAVMIAAVAGAILANRLRQLDAPPGGGPLWDQPLPPPEERPLFAESLQPIPWDWRGWVICICIYAGFAALQVHAAFVACVLAAECAFFFTSPLTNPRLYLCETFNPRARAARRFVRVILPALLITVLAMLAGSSSRSGAGNTDAKAPANDHGVAGEKTASSRQPAQGPAVGFDGYQSIVLWPNPPKKEFVPPIPLRTPAKVDRTAKPIVIRFDGSYWYFQPPATRPGPRSHVAHGNPLDVDIQSANFIPLMMEADQNLATAIRISQCREIQVDIQNRDNWPGRISIGVLLTDSASTGKPTLYLGERPVVSSQPDRFTRKLVPVEETLRFPLPNRPAIRRFDEITLMVITEVGHTETGAKIAIQQLEFLPR